MNKNIIIGIVVVIVLVAAFYYFYGWTSSNNAPVDQGAAVQDTVGQDLNNDSQDLDSLKASLQDSANDQKADVPSDNKSNQ